MLHLYIILDSLLFLFIITSAYSAFFILFYFWFIAVNDFRNEAFLLGIFNNGDNIS